MARSQGHQDGESCPVDDSSALRHATGEVPKPAPDTIHVRGLRSSPRWTQYVWLHHVQRQQSLEELYKRMPGAYGYKAQSPGDEHRGVSQRHPWTLTVHSNKTVRSATLLSHEDHSRSMAHMIIQIQSDARMGARFGCSHRLRR